MDNCDLHAIAKQLDEELTNKVRRQASLIAAARARDSVNGPVSELDDEEEIVSITITNDGQTLVINDDDKEVSVEPIAPVSRAVEYEVEEEDE